MRVVIYTGRGIALRYVDLLIIYIFIEEVVAGSFEIGLALRSLCVTHGLVPVLRHKGGSALILIYLYSVELKMGVYHITQILRHIDFGLKLHPCLFIKPIKKLGIIQL